MEVAELAEKRGKSLLSVAGALVFVAIALFLPAARDERLVWAGGLFGLCALTFLVLLLRPRRLIPSQQELPLTPAEYAGGEELAMPQTEDDIDAIRQILVNWSGLSAGDISTLFAALNRPGSQLITTPGTPNCFMWQQFERLGWARTAQTSLPPQVKAFSLTSEGGEMLPKLIQRFDLRPGNSYRPDDAR